MHSIVYPALMQQDHMRTIDVFLGDGTNPLIVILGPTASGKTSFSIDVAHHVKGEIVNADSRQIYKYLNIGTAKITEDEMDGVPHHLIDVCDPKEEITVGWYQDEASKIISEIHDRGSVPILVGGSMLYLASITDGLSMAPAVDAKRHQELLDAYDRDGGKALYKRLQKIDPDAAAAIHPNNKPRIVRAIEIYEVLKAPKSKVMREKGELRPREGLGFGFGLGEGKKSEYDLLVFGVERSADSLKKRIVERTEKMLDGGWIEEVRDLVAQGYSENDPGMKSHGYRQIMEYLKEVELGEGDSEQMKEKLKETIRAKTWQYARRQLTWWRGDERIRWIHL